MLPYFMLDKIDLGIFSLYTWGLFLTLGFLAGLFWFKQRAKELGEAVSFRIGLLALLGGVLGARLLFVLQSPGLFWQSPLDIFKIWQGGLISFGGFIGGAIIVWLYLKKYQPELKILRIFDLLVLPAVLGIAITRIGCFLIHDHPGAITNLPWGLGWPDSSVLHHPVALYLILSNLVLLLILLQIEHWHKNRPAGMISLVFIVYYCAARFGLDFTRIGEPQSGGLFVSQWLAAAMLLGVIIMWWLKKVRQRRISLGVK